LRSSTVIQIMTQGSKLTLPRGHFVMYRLIDAYENTCFSYVRSLDIGMQHFISDVYNYAAWVKEGKPHVI
jgi:hypothetical protein